MFEQPPCYVIEEKREGRVEFHVDDGPVFHVNPGEDRSQQVLLLIEAELLMELALLALTWARKRRILSIAVREAFDGCALPPGSNPPFP